MRNQLCDALVERAARPDMVFLTGDLGFMALEPLQRTLGERFINAGVSEQNMISVSAALAAQGLDVWVYSIAPFCYARPFEQIRNDVAFHELPVRLIGNGGGYGYGVMGPTHHAIEDCGVLLTLPGISVFVPVFDEDVAKTVEHAGTYPGTAYLRLGRGEPPRGFTVPAYAPWRQLTAGGGWTVAALGPLAGTYVEAAQSLPEGARPNLWAVAELPVSRCPPPEAFVRQAVEGPGLCIAEEHVRHGGLGSALVLHLADHGLAPRRFAHLYATAHHFERYGSQAYLRRQAGLDPDTFLARIRPA